MSANKKSKFKFENLGKFSGKVRKLCLYTVHCTYEDSACIVDDTGMISPYNPKYMERGHLMRKGVANKLVSELARMGIESWQNKQEGERLKTMVKMVKGNAEREEKEYQLYLNIIWDD